MPAAVRTRQRRARLTWAQLAQVLGLGLAFAITAVDPLMLSLNLTEVSHGLAVPSDKLGFLSGLATLVIAAAVLAIGNLGDRFGLKRLLLFGFALNVFAQLLGAVSPTYWFLLMARFLDGLALTALLGLSLALLRVSIPDEIRPIALGVFMATDAFLFGVTPLIGGQLVAALGWRYLFLVTPVLALGGLMLTIRHVAEPPVRRGAGFDVLGVVLFGCALLCLVFGVGEIQNGFTVQAWGPLLVAAVALTLFVIQELRTPRPALDLSLFRIAPFVIAVVSALTLNFLSAGFSVVLSQFGGNVLNLSARAIGQLYLPGTLVLAAVSVLTGRLIARYGARPVLLVGLIALTTAGLVQAATTTPTMAVWLLVLITWLGNLGCFLTSTPASDIVMSHAPPEKAGAVTAVQPTFGMIGYALGPTVYILLINLLFQRQWLADAESRALSAQQARHDVDAVTAAMANSPGNTGYNPNLVQQMQGLTLGVDYSNAVRITMAVVSLLPLVVILLTVVFVPRARRREADRGAV
ncbi:MFS transporter [Amycolatopsis rhizosphaerae]|uniref:MFS transporter n=1 Tax=Amycolatopsis rhizosphaerae TaxID=2053003 RepID=A0A558DHR7_9PSEU|nr:MFS transporter [Amycolatopsis rhizosphaerae]TVT60567.1 MFS transporter [Amycolatopsis rhizosphaerae]